MNRVRWNDIISQLDLRIFQVAWITILWTTFIFRLRDLPGEVATCIYSKLGAEAGFSWAVRHFSMGLPGMKGSSGLVARDLSDCLAIYLKYIEPIFTRPGIDICSHLSVRRGAPFTVLERAAALLGL